MTENPEQETACRLDESPSTILNNDIHLGRDEGPAVDLVGLFQHRLRPLQQILNETNSTNNITKTCMYRRKFHERSAILYATYILNIR